MRLTYRFVPMGTVAPDQLAPNEIWLDVGGRARSGVFDHHSGDTNTWSAAQLVLDRSEALLSHTAGQETCSVVLHAPPDLDAVCSVWLAQRILRLPSPITIDTAVKAIVDAVSENDQGLVRAADPKDSWPLVMRTLIHEEHGLLPSDRILKEALKALDTTYETLVAGRTLRDAAQQLISHTIRANLEHAELAYRADLERATKFQVRLPVRLLGNHAPSVPDGFAAPPPDTDQWILADGLHFDDPACTLFKELARADRKNSPLGMGFPLLVVSSRVGNEDSAAQWRHVLSTDRLSGFHLQGLGSMLERREKMKEEDNPTSLPQGRRRVPDGEGRFGLDVASPWYDGRGHGFTIIDSPNRSDSDAPCYASLLTPAEVLDALWEFGDPARFMHVRECRVSVLLPVTLQKGWTAYWRPGPVITESCPLLDPDAQALDSFVQVHLPARAAGAPTQAAIGAERLLVLPGREGLWTGEIRFEREPRNLRELAILAQAVVDRSAALDAPRGLARSSVAPPVAIFHTRVSRTEVAIPPGTGPTAQSVFRISRGKGAGFDARGTEREIEGAHKVDALDREALFFSAGRSLVLLSARQLTFDQEGKYYRPDTFSLLAGYVFCLRSRLEEISQRFRDHRLEARAFFGGNKVVEDRSTLFVFEQEALCRRFTSHGFGQAVFEALARRFGVTEAHAAAKERIEALAKHVSESRSNLYQRIGFVLSMVFAPLAILSRFVPQAGWTRDSAVLFIGVFTLLVVVLGLTWIIGLAKFRRVQRESLKHVHQP